MELFKLFGTIALDNSAANNGIEETTGKASKAHTKIVDSFKKIGTAVATYFAVDKIIDFGSACIQAAADASAMNSQFTQVFGELEGQAAANLSQLADQAGITENRMKGSYTKIAAFAKTSGMETSDALSLADRAMQAVADSAAFYDRSLEDTTESLQSFLKGNFENDAALGLSCTETTRNAAANELYGKSFQELSESQKQLTLLKMVEDANALSGAMGQAARESDTWTNQTGNLKQAWTDFKAVVGANFLEPAVGAIKGVTQVVEELSGKVPVVVEWFRSMYDRASQYFPAIKETFASLWNEAQQVWESIGRPIWDMIQNCIQSVSDVFSQKMPEIQEFVSQCFADIRNFWNDNLKPCLEAIGDFIENILAPVFDKVFNTYIKGYVDTCFQTIKNLWNNVLKPVFTGITDFLTGVFTGDWEKAWNGILEVFKGIINLIPTTLEQVINAGIDLLNGLIEGINAITSVIGLGTIDFIHHVELPKLEKGGVLEKGQVGILEGNGAEAVVPLDQNKKWINAVAQDMDAAMGNGSAKEIQELREVVQDLVDELPGMMAKAFASMKFEINSREFARLSTKVVT